MINPLLLPYEWFLVFFSSLPGFVHAFLFLVVFLAIISALFRWFL